MRSSIVAIGRRRSLMPETTIVEKSVGIDLAVMPDLGFLAAERRNILKLRGG